MPKYQIIGTGPFDGVEGETVAVSPDKAISNVAFRKGVDYYYFRSNAEVKIIPKAMHQRTNFSKWMERRID